MQSYLNEFLLNKIPLIKKLKLREVVSVKALWGGLRQENDPAYTDKVFQWSNDALGRPISYALNDSPSIGEGRYRQHF